MHSLTEHARLKLFEELAEKYEDNDDRFLFYRIGQQNKLAFVYVERVRRSKIEVIFVHFIESPYLEMNGIISSFLVYVLAESYQKTGAFRLSFRGSKAEADIERGYEPGIPYALVKFAKTKNISLSSKWDSIRHSKGRALLLRIVGINKGLEKQFEEKGVDTARVAFLLSRQVWLKNQIETIVRECSNFRLIFDGTYSLSSGLSFFRDLNILRSIIATERFDAHLQIQSDSQKGKVSFLSYRDKSTRFTVDVEISITCEGKSLIIKPKTQITAYIAILTAEGYQLYHDQLIRDAVNSEVAILVVTNDFNSMKLAVRQSFLGKASSAGLAVFVIADACWSLEEEALTRMKQSSSTFHQQLERES